MPCVYICLSVSSPSFVCVCVLYAFMCVCVWVKMYVRWFLWLFSVYLWQISYSTQTHPHIYCSQLTFVDLVSAATCWDYRQSRAALCLCGVSVPATKLILTHVLCPLGHPLISLFLLTVYIMWQVASSSGELTFNISPSCLKLFFFPSRFFFSHTISKRANLWHLEQNTDYCLETCSLLLLIE